jgi:hypothetical protein
MRTALVGQPAGGFRDRRRQGPERGGGIQAWLRDISQKVAEAAVEGSFLGFGGVRVSDTETATLHDISKALGTAS